MAQVRSLRRFMQRLVVPQQLLLRRMVLKVVLQFGAVWSGIQASGQAICRVYVDWERRMSPGHTGTKAMLKTMAYQN